LHHFCDIARYWSKIADFNDLHLVLRFGVTPSDFSGIFGIRKLESLGYHAALFAWFWVQPF